MNYLEDQDPADKTHFEVPVGPSPTQLSPHRPSEAEAMAILHRAREVAATNARAHQAERVEIREVERPAPVSQAQIDEYDHEQAERAKYERVQRCFQMADIPERYRQAQLGYLPKISANDLNRYQDAVRRLQAAEEKSGIYVLVGAIGAGKTHMACALLNAFCRAGRSAKFIEAYTYVSLLRASWNSHSAGATERFERDFLRFNLLVLDEWGAKYDTPSENLHLFRLINKRYEARVTTVLLSNAKSRDEFAASIDARIADRMYDRTLGGGGGIIMCNWESLRGQTQ